MLFPLVTEEAVSAGAVQLQHGIGIACVWIVLFRFGPRLRASSYSHVAFSLRHVPHGLVLSHRSFLRRQKEHAMDKVESKTTSQRDQGTIEMIVIKEKRYFLH